MSDPHASTDRYVKQPASAGQVELLLSQPGGTMSAAERQALVMLARQQDEIVDAVNRATRKLEDFGKIRQALLWVGGIVTLGVLAFLGKMGLFLLDLFIKAKP